MGLREVGIGLALAALCAAPSASAATGPALTIDASAGRHAISPYIYGWNYAPAAFAKEIDLPVDRRGGNSADTLNWQTGVENHSNDYFFENLPTCWADCPAGWDPAHSYTDQIAADRDAHAKTLLDLPMLGILPKDMGDNNAVYCSYSVAKYGAQTDADPYDPDCGSGLAQGGGAPIANDPADTGVAKGPEFQGEWIDALKSRYGDAAGGGVGFYELGNEPGLWNSTHRDWHPDPVTYDELGQKSLALAEVVKAHDPTAQVVGFSEWGWPNFFCSAADDTSDGCQSSDTDRAAHGGTPIAEWFLQQFKAYADAHSGERLLDYFDVHYYRQDDGSSGIAGTRSLWDPTYHDPSWIDDTIRMIPRMHEWVDQNYPGTKLAFSEYDLAVDHSADLDNLIQADALGIFAREGLDLATLWPETDNTHYQDAFRLFRNYDGNKAKFGDTFVSSQSADQGQLSVYGATRSSDGALTLAVINKTATDLTSTIALGGFAPGGVAQVWTWTGTGTGIKLVAAPTVTAQGLTHTFPRGSMSMVVVPPAPATPSGGGAQPGGTTTTVQTPPTTSQQTPAQQSPPPVIRCVVPKLKGLTLAKAKTKLRTAHCRIGRVTKKKSRVRKGRVIAQTPKAGKRLPSGSKVAVVLSRGR